MTPAGWVVRRWPALVLAALVNTVLLTILFRYMGVESCKFGGAYDGLSPLIRLTFRSSAISIATCSRDANCHVDCFLKPYFAFYFVEIILITLLAAQVGATDAISDTEQLRTVLLIVFIPIVGFEIMNYASGKVLVLGFPITRLEDGGIFIAIQGLMMVLFLGCWFTAVANVVASFRAVSSASSR